MRRNPLLEGHIHTGLPALPSRLKIGQDFLGKAQGDRLLVRRWAGA